MNAVAGCLAITKSYAAFVWPAYAIAGLVLGAVVLQSWRRYRASLHSLARLQPRDRTS